MIARRGFHVFFRYSLLGLALLAASARIGAASVDAPRLALVIGNSSYQRLPRLPTSVNDAFDVAAALTALGFQVKTELELSLQQMKDAMARFLEQLGEPENRGALAVFYFAGHGIQYSGHNFMLPNDFDIDQGQDGLDKRALWLDGQIARPMTSVRDAGANVIVLEACREDPFGDNPGLAQVDIEKNLPERALIMFAAAPGQPSADEVDLKAPERNGIFTRELVEQLGKVGANVDLESFFDVVQFRVLKASNEAQKPRKMARLGREPMLLAAAERVRPGLPPKAGLSEELKLWRAVEKSPDSCDFEHYLARYPTGEFSDSARAKLRAIQDKNEALARNLRNLPQSVIETVKAEQARYEARCAARYGNRRASVSGAFGVEQRTGPERSTARARRSGLQRVSTRTEAPWGREQSLRRVRIAQRAEGDRAHVAALRGVQDARVAPASDGLVGDDAFQATLLRAQQGDVDAMYRVALIYERGTNSVTRNTDEMLRWLVVSSALGNGLASYKLYRHYNAERRTLAEAIKYKSLAKKQGYAGPPGLSIRR